jgi:hypothetical protein
MILPPIKRSPHEYCHDTLGVMLPTLFRDYWDNSATIDETGDRCRHSRRSQALKTYHHRL